MNFDCYHRFTVSVKNKKAVKFQLTKIFGYISLWISLVGFHQSSTGIRELLSYAPKGIRKLEKIEKISS